MNDIKWSAPEFNCLYIKIIEKQWQEGKKH